MPHKTTPKLRFEPLTKENWGDFVTLFGEKGASGGCWCMWWRLKRSEFEKNKGKRNKEAMQSIVSSGEIPGLLAYADGKPVGWCSVAPREKFSSLERSRVLKRIDDKPVWSIVCFFIDKRYRNKGVSVKLLSACIKYVKEKGGKVLEGYPVEPKKGRMPDVFAWTGFSNAFKDAGFVECSRHSEPRPIMRYYID
ncbi:MAG: GNAT family N-acetyltransferase [Candidatus Dadabacteria bacterium]|nr:GNAT family N-acetyltransferase [Candidatus Dadabacteria bacterium]